MTKRIFASVLLATLLPLAPALAADNPTLLTLATCQESWRDWKENPARIQSFRDALSGFRAQDREPFYLPTQPATLLGFPVVRLYPDSVGMAVGFSVLADASFDAVKASLEKQTSKAITRCETEGGARSCELKIGEKRTVILMEEGRGKNAKTLFGCYYFYAQ